MRCDQCNKFVSFEEDDPEVEDLEVDEDGSVTGTVRIVNTCAECGQELKEATLDIDSRVDVPDGHKGEGHELTVEEAGSERTSRSGYYKKGEWVSAGGRYAKTYYGASVDYTVTCSCGNFTAEGQWEDDVQASGMEEMI